jgi:hypothetical protein
VAVELDLFIILNLIIKRQASTQAAMALFKSDTRGMGGQKQIMDLMANHYTALVNVKPTINTREPVRKHVGDKRQARPSSAAKSIAEAFPTS